MNIKEKIEELKKDLKEVDTCFEEEREELIRQVKEEILREIDKKLQDAKEKEQEFNPEPYELFLSLSMSGGHLLVCYKDEIGVHKYISTILKAPLVSCFICNQEAYEEWLSNGCKVADQEPVEWQGAKYTITKTKILQNISIDRGNIFDYETGQPIQQCGDTNIARYSNNTPISGGQQ